jgi:hypothetical protein
MRMQMNIKRGVWIAVMTLSVGISGGPVLVKASPSPQEQHEQDYSKNKRYQQGMREGKDDQAHKRDHSKKRQFKNDEDQKAYESGYQQGHKSDALDHQGNRSDR